MSGLLPVRYCMQVMPTQHDAFLCLGMQSVGVDKLRIWHQRVYKSTKATMILQLKQRQRAWLYLSRILADSGLDTMGLFVFAMLLAYYNLGSEE